MEKAGGSPAPQPKNPQAGRLHHTILLGIRRASEGSVSQVRSIPRKTRMGAADGFSSNVQLSVKGAVDL
jgi:hypothetical protein